MNFTLGGKDGGLYIVTEMVEVPFNHHSYQYQKLTVEFVEDGASLWSLLRMELHCGGWSFTVEFVEDGASLWRMELHCGGWSFTVEDGASLVYT
ncbi:hypothetical protein Pcinc_030956 [Petrolisthes cinctipes]|uniref:Uncharacterized protein n=1 Tax=Petrolisthes cinctipes TaxID=88211 RepID=A0AAE1EXP6_PETCI|nr:hypothetical protein Pcinc_030956 [Petrolisthes cinctipes]